MKNNYYNPLEFASSAGILTIAIIGGYISWRLINTLYQELYDPLIDSIIPNEECRRHFIKVKKYRINVGVILKEFIKWLILIIILMTIYNMALQKNDG